MNQTTFDVKDMLEAESALGLTFADNLFIGREPSLPNDCITLFDGAGEPPELTFGNDTTIDRPGITIYSRSKDYKVASDLIQSVKWFLHGKHNETWNGAVYLSIVCTGEPYLLDWDSNNRARFVCNFSMIRRRV